MKIRKWKEKKIEALDLRHFNVASLSWHKSCFLVHIDLIYQTKYNNMDLFYMLAKYDLI